MFYLGTESALKISPRLPIGVGFALVGFAPLIASYVENFHVFAVLYASLFGMGVGCAYFTPIAVGWSYFEEYKGRVSGLIGTGHGLGAAIFNQITTAIINPNNVKPSEGDDGSLGYYDWEVAS